MCKGQDRGGTKGAGGCGNTGRNQSWLQVEEPMSFLAGSRQYQPPPVPLGAGVDSGAFMGSHDAGTGPRSRCSAIRAAPRCRAQPLTSLPPLGRSAERAAQPGQPGHRAVGNRPAAALGHRRLRVCHLPHHPLCPPGALPHQEELFPPAPHLHVPVWLGECRLPRQDGVPSSPRPSPIQVTLRSLQSGRSQASPPRGEGAEPTLAHDACPAGPAAGQRGARCP